MGRAYRALGQPPSIQSRHPRHRQPSPPEDSAPRLGSPPTQYRTVPRRAVGSFQLEGLGSADGHQGDGDEERWAERRCSADPPGDRRLGSVTLRPAARQLGAGGDHGRVDVRTLPRRLVGRQPRPPVASQATARVQATKIDIARSSSRLRPLPRPGGRFWPNGCAVT